MNPDEIKYRKCSVTNCTYREVRGSRQGDFINGKFVCPTHAHPVTLCGACGEPVAKCECTQPPVGPLPQAGPCTRLLTPEEHQRALAFAIAKLAYLVINRG